MPKLSAIPAEITQAAERHTRAAKLAAERAYKRIEPARLAMLEADIEDTREQWRSACDAANVARAHLRNAEAAAHEAAAALGASPSFAHALAIYVTRDAREAAQDAARSARITREALYLVERKAARYSTRYN